MNKRHFVYTHTSPSGKVYVGQTVNIKNRWGTNGEHYKTKKKDGSFIQPNFARAIVKYGWDNFEHKIILEHISKSEADYAEKYLIKWYKLHNMSYNCTDGGEGACGIHRVLSEEQKEKCRIANLGKHHTDKAREAIRQALLRRDHSIYDKIAEKRRGAKRDQEIVMKGAIKRRKAILQYDLKGNFIKEFEGATQAGFGKGTNITACCKGRLISSCGYIWRYKESDNFPLVIDVPKKWNDRKLKVAQYNKDGVLIAIFDSISDASRTTGINTGNICQCLKGKYKFTKGFMWKYIEGKEVQYA